MAVRRESVTVVGGGMAGWTAAISAQESGASVTLLERGRRRPGWGNSLVSGGALHAALSSPRLPVADLVRKATDATDGHTDPILARAWAESAAETVRWIEEHGGALVADGTASHRSVVLAPPRQTEPGLKYAGTGMHDFLSLLAGEFVRRGGHVEQPARARTLRAAGTAGWELGVDHPDRRERIRSRSVVLADGGFQASPALLRRHVGTDRVKLRATRSSTGDGLRMGLSVGGVAVNMEGFYGHLLAREALHDGRFWPYPILDGLSAAGIVVDSAGRRFVDEGHSGVTTTNAVARSTSPDGCWLICDHAAWENEGRVGHVAPNPYLLDQGAVVLSAPTVGELAASTGIDAGALAAAVESVHDPSTALHRSRRDVSLSRPPFYALPLVAGVSFTLGGLHVDGNGTVLDASGRGIDGLYAAGGTMGGLHGGPRDGYVGGLLEAAVFGRRAGRHAAEATR